VIVDGVSCTSDHRRLSEVSSLALRKAKKAIVNADQRSLVLMMEWALLLSSWFYSSFKMLIVLGRCCLEVSP